MKQRIPVVVCGALALATASLANAGVQVNINPFGWIAPPVVYQPAPFYAAPPVVYVGGGSWGDHHRGHSRRDHRRR
jgi:hypothetical protein